MSTPALYHAVHFLEAPPRHWSSSSRLHTFSSFVFAPFLGTRPCRRFGCRRAAWRIRTLLVYEDTALGDSFAGKPTVVAEAIQSSTLRVLNEHAKQRFFQDLNPESQTAQGATKCPEARSPGDETCQMSAAEGSVALPVPAFQFSRSPAPQWAGALEIIFRPPPLVVVPASTASPRGAIAQMPFLGGTSRMPGPVSAARRAAGVLLT